MGSLGEQEEGMVYVVRISSVGPGMVTGLDSAYEPTNLDLAMKLHYHRLVYLFDSEAVQECGLTVPKLKEATFTWLNFYYESCGRFRRSDQTGRPYIKCNDCGARFIEAKSSKTVQEWARINLEDASKLRLLAPTQVLGPELTFSPPVFLQITNLKCGGVALGLGCAHVLGDFFSVSEYMNLWAQMLSGYQPTHSPNLNKLKAHEPKSPKQMGPEAQLLKRVGPLGDHWEVTSTSKMGTLSFHLTSTELANLQEKVSGPNGPVPSPFETLCGVIWQAVAKAQSGPEEPKRVTIIKEGTPNGKEILRNTQVLSVVEADFEVKDANPSQLAQLISDNAVDVRGRISETVASELEGPDFLVYGSNLTFVNLEGANLYGFTIKGHKPRLVAYFVDAVGEEGAVFVLPGPPKEDEKKEDGGRLVTMILPENLILDVQHKLAKEWSIAHA